MHSHSWLLMLAVAAILLPGSTPEPLAVQVQNVIQGYVKRQDELTKDSAAASTYDQRSKIEFSRLPVEDECTHQLFQLAKEHADDPASEDALIWILHNARLAAPDFDKAVDLYRQRYSTSAKVGAACPHLMGYSGSKSVAQLMRAVVKKNPSVANRAIASFSLAKVLQDSKPEEAKKLLNKTIKDYGSSGTQEHSQTIDKLAKDTLFELEHLRIGTPAPEISGTDVDDTVLKLSSYRGKVVMVVFFGSWCGPCRAMFPHEQALTQKFPAEQFALLGIDADDKDKMKEMLSSKDVTWPCIVDGATQGLIATAWHVHGWPNMYIIDRNGIIRYKPTLNDTEKIDKQIESLIAEEKQKRK